MKRDLSVLTDLANEIAINDSEAAFRELYMCLYAPIRRFAFCLLKSPFRADEVASDVMVTLWRKRSSLTEVNNIQVYAFVIAKHLCLKIIKEQAGGRLVSLDEIDINLQLDTTNPEQALINAELGQALNNAIAALPPRCKLIFKLVKEDGLSYKEVADILNIAYKTVDAQMVIAVKKLSVEIKKEFKINI